MTKKEVEYLNENSSDQKLRKHKAGELVSKHKGKVFKDKDIVQLQFKLKLSKSQATSLIECFKEDTDILKKYSCTDYSVLLSVHSNEEKITINNYSPIRTMFSYNKELIYSISIIDFLIEYNINKEVEKRFKLFKHYIKGDDDNNISAEEPIKYADRMVEFVESNCLEIIK